MTLGLCVDLCLCSSCLLTEQLQYYCC